MIYITGDCHGDWRRFSKARFPAQEEMTHDDFEMVADCIEFGKWYFGHYHQDRAVTDRYIMIYRQIVRIN